MGHPLADKQLGLNSGTAWERPDADGVFSHLLSILVPYSPGAEGRNPVLMSSPNAFCMTHDYPAEKAGNTKVTEDQMTIMLCKKQMAERGR